MPLRSALALAATLGLLCGTAAAQSPSPESPRREIVVTGAGEASAKPDLARANFAVVHSGKTAREALDGANQAMTRVIEGMKSAGIEARDLQTSGFAITPQYVYDNNNDGTQKPPELVGYEARNDLSVRLRDMTKIGEILDSAVTLGVNSGGDISFGMDDTAKLEREARQNAVRDAMETAKVVAEAAGVTLGEIRTVDTRDSSIALPPPPSPRMLAMDASAMKASVPVEAGETTVRTSVSITFAIGG